MKYLPVLLVVFLFACGQNDSEKKTTTADTITTQPPPPDASGAGSPPGAAIYEQYLPAALMTHVRQSIPNWKLPDPSAWEKYWFDEYRKDKSLVNFVSGDFNCDSAIDHALILVNEKGDIGAWAFLAKNGGFENTRLDEFENLSGGPIGAGLLILPKGEHGHITADGDMGKPVKVNCEGVTVIFFEKAARSYYWEKGKVKAIQTGD